MIVIPHCIPHKEVGGNMSKLKEFWHDLFNEKWIDGGGGGIVGHTQAPLIKLPAKWLWQWWLKYWQPVCGAIAIIIAALTFYFQYLRK